MSAIRRDPDVYVRCTLVENETCAGTHCSFLSSRRLSKEDGDDQSQEKQAAIIRPSCFTRETLRAFASEPVETAGTGGFGRSSTAVESLGSQMAKMGIDGAAMQASATQIIEGIMCRPPGGPRSLRCTSLGRLHSSQGTDHRMLIHAHVQISRRPEVSVSEDLLRNLDVPGCVENSLSQGVTESTAHDRCDLCKEIDNRLRKYPNIAPYSNSERPIVISSVDS